jgi:hypothetical protein
MSVTAVPLPPVERRVVGGLWLGLALLALVGIAVAWYTTSRVALPPKAFLARNAKQPGVVVMPSGLQYQVLRLGTGVRPTVSDVALVNYVGKLADGKIFDQGHMAPFAVARTVPGFAEALTLMPVGSKYRFWIPPALGYPEGNGPIPPNALLIFDVDLLTVVPQSAIFSPAAQAPEAVAPHEPPAGIAEPSAEMPASSGEAPSGVTVHSGERPPGDAAQ